MQRQNIKRRRGRSATVLIRCTPGLFQLLTRSDPHAVNMLNAHLQANHGMLHMIQGRKPGMLSFCEGDPALVSRPRCRGISLSSHQIGRLVGRCVLERFEHHHPPERPNDLRRWLLARIRRMLKHWPRDEPFPLTITEDQAVRFPTLLGCIEHALHDAANIACQYIAKRRHFLTHSRRWMTAAPTGRFMTQ